MTTVPAQRYRIRGRNNEIIEFDGVRLGHGSSHEDGRPRWFEVEIYRRAGGGLRYVVVTRGRTRVEGETTGTSGVETDPAFEIISILTVHHNDKTYIPRQSDRALAQAAQWDDDVRDAYINRAVT